MYKKITLVVFFSALCSYAGLYGLAVMEYHRQINAIQSAIEDIHMQAEKDVRALTKIPQIQAMTCPVEPQILAPNTILYPPRTKYKEGILQLKEMIETRKSSLSKLVFEKLHLRYGQLEGADLGGCIFKKSDLSFAHLQAANLSTTSFQQADLRGAILDNANCYLTNFTESHLNYASLVGADIRAGNFRAAFLIGVNLSHSDLRKANLPNTDLINSNLSQADLRGSSLVNARLHGTIFQGADLSESNLSGVISRSQEPHITSFEGSNLTRANLKHAVLTGVNFDQAIFFMADLSDANLIDAKNLTAQQLSQAKSLRNTRLDPRLLSDIKKSAAHLFVE